MTELDQARAHLRDAQAHLAAIRFKDKFSRKTLETMFYPMDSRRTAENKIKAALSWVWDAQERAQKVGDHLQSE